MEDKKEYMFDSLVYRFKDAQAQAFHYLVEQDKYKRNMDEQESICKVHELQNRDLMRFIEILTEAMEMNK